MQQVLHEHLEVGARVLVLAIDFADVGIDLLDLFQGQWGHVPVTRIELQARALGLRL